MRSTFSTTPFHRREHDVELQRVSHQRQGIVTGSPTITSTALGRNANGSFNVTGFGAVTSPAAGALAARACFS